MMEEKDRLDDFLHEIIQEGGLERAPGGFTQQVMAEVVAEAAPARVRWRPVISRWGWVGIAAMLVVGLFVVLGLPWGDSRDLFPGGKDAVANAMDATVNGLSSLKVPGLLMMCVAAGFLLVALDRFLGRRMARAR
jgi:hypothetical protein